MLETKSTWDAYVLKKPLAKPFRNHGWDLWDDVSQLMPQKAHGGNVYTASQQTDSQTPIESQTGQDSQDPWGAVGEPRSPAWDMSRFDAPLDGEDELVGGLDVNGMIGNMVSCSRLT
jgi:hypothetical protein